jgi:hypothetical protein
MEWFGWVDYPSLPEAALLQWKAGGAFALLGDK